MNVILKTEMNQREPDHLMLTPKKATSLEWKAIQSLVGNNFLPSYKIAVTLWSTQKKNNNNLSK